MADPRDFSRTSWRLKIARAEHHVRELESEIGRYAHRHAYEARRLDKSNTDPNHLFWTLHFTEQPDPSLAIVLGDVLTNIRAALDHIAIALAPHRSDNHAAWFPIVADIGKFTPHPTDEERRIHEKGRESFAKAVKGMHPDAVAKIESLQPYNVRPVSAIGTPQTHALLVLNRLVQADKHKKLIPIASGLAQARSFIVVHSVVQNHGWYADLFDDGAIVADFNITSLPPGFPDRHVQVHIHGTPRITVEVVQGLPNNEVMKLLRLVLNTLRDDVFPTLEQCIPA